MSHKRGAPVTAKKRMRCVIEFSAKVDSVPNVFPHVVPHSLTCEHTLIVSLFLWACEIVLIASSRSRDVTHTTGVHVDVETRIVAG